MELMEEIGTGPVGLDTAVFIYFIEEHTEFLPVVEPLFAAIDAGPLQGVTSALTLLETLVVPYRVGNTALAERYELLLTRTIREDFVFAHSRPQERCLRSGGFRRGAHAPCSRLTRANPERSPANAGRSRSPEGG